MLSQKPPDDTVDGLSGAEKQVVDPYFHAALGAHLDMQEDMRQPN